MINRYLFSRWLKIQFVQTLQLKQNTSFEIPGLYRCWFEWNKYTKVKHLQEYNLLYIDTPNLSWPYMTKLFLNVSKSIRIIKQDNIDIERNRICQSEEIDKFLLELSCHILVMSANKNRSKMATLSIKSNQNKL